MGNIEEYRAERKDAVDRAGIPAFRGFKSLPPARRLILGVQRQKEESSMMLTPCPACGNKVSTQAPTCPHCGHPLAGSASGPAPQSPGALLGGRGKWLAWT